MDICEMVTMSSLYSITRFYRLNFAPPACAIAGTCLWSQAEEYTIGTCQGNANVSLH